MSSIDLVVLGIVLEKPQSAYDIQKDVEYHNLSKWTKISVPSIYRKVLQLKEKGYSKIYLWVLEKNERARRFYEKNGFTWNGDRLEGEEGGRKVTDLRYVLSFPKTNLS